MKKLIIFIAITGLSLATVFAQSNAEKPNQKTRKTKMEKKFINPKKLAKSPALSHAVSVKGGRTIYVSGQIPLNEKGELIGNGDFKKQTEQVFENIKFILKEAGANFSDVVKLTYFVKNLEPSMVQITREVRSQYLPPDKPLPSTSLIGVQGFLRKDILIEIECIAVVED
ncbi:MAG: RidA family protein [Pyrinomonadaceae bacterium]